DRCIAKDMLKLLNERTLHFCVNMPYTLDSFFTYCSQLWLQRQPDERRVVAVAKMGAVPLFKFP
ncbi:MAG: hypothetical protein AAFY76_08170, partial [Cyanobacteria bacterium J06649_11]